ncbi:MAG: hypothetical protein H7Y18_20560 [Clostridiaceae bacterium]|nr:hypothetical protein [Clostridiaceae bacterium]
MRTVRKRFLITMFNMIWVSLFAVIVAISFILYFGDKKMWLEESPHSSITEKTFGIIILTLYLMILYIVNYKSNKRKKVKYPLIKAIIFSLISIILGVLFGELYGVSIVSMFYTIFIG